MRIRILLVAVAIAIGVVTPTALARGTSELGAVRAEYQRVALLEYFGPPGTLCAQFTAADRQVFSRSWTARPATCVGAARSVMHLLRHCISAHGYTPSGWRNGVQQSMALLKVHILSARSARVTDPLLEHGTLVRVGHHWRFAKSWPSVEC